MLRLKFLILTKTFAVENDRETECHTLVQVRKKNSQQSFSSSLHRFWKKVWLFKRKFSAEACVSGGYLAKHHENEECVEQHFVQHSSRFDHTDADSPARVQVLAIDNVHVVLVFELLTRGLLLV